MKARVYSTALAAALLSVTCVLGSAGLAEEAAQNADHSTSAEDLVQAALEAEATGNSERRDGLLRRALYRDPEYAPARWHSGYVRLDHEWLSVEEIAQRASADERLGEYRRLREVQAGTPTPAGELALARWCRDKGLDAEARFHWLRLLQFQPQHQEALKSVGMRWHQGRLLTHDQIREGKEHQRAEAEQRRESRWDIARWEARWESLLAKWRRAIEQGDPDVDRSIRDELRAIGDLQPREASAAMDTLDSLILERSESHKKREEEALRKLSLEWVRALDAMSQWQATQSLVRHAVCHAMPEVRTAAADALGRRPQESYVPMLLARMRMPVEASFAISVYPDGRVSYQHSFYREGPEADTLETRNELIDLMGKAPLMLYWPREERVPNWRRSDQPWTDASLRARVGAAARAADTQRLAEQANAMTMRLNWRIQQALTRATGVDLPADPKRWWQWWRDQWYDYYEWDKPEPTEKPVYERGGCQVQVCHICFARGTKVWTLMGPVPIEEIRPGDRVLSRDPESGELAYKPVLEATTSHPTPMVKIDLGSETITATRGHWFYVSGKGWQMAKQLAAGLPLHGVSGAASVAGVEEIPAGEPWEGFTHNLIVDDFHTYFVGDSRVLVQDGTFFGRPMGWVAGLSAP